MFPALVGMNRTRLDYRQWVQVRTPAFKQRFGDWENDTENERPSTGVDRRIAESDCEHRMRGDHAWYAEHERCGQVRQHVLDQVLVAEVARVVMTEPRRVVDQQADRTQGAAGRGYRIEAGR